MLLYSLQQQRNCVLYSAVKHVGTAGVGVSAGHPAYKVCINSAASGLASWLAGLLGYGDITGVPPVVRICRVQALQGLPLQRAYSRQACCGWLLFLPIDG